MAVGQLSWEKIDLIRALKYLFAILLDIVAAVRRGHNTEMKKPF